MDDANLTSVQKVTAAALRLDELEPDNAETAGMLLALTAMRPKLLSMLPDDAAVLDELLTKGALWFLALRSDDAPGLEVSQAGAGRLEAST